MSTVDAQTASCQVLTYKDGLLARAAHDLLLEVKGFSIRFDVGGIIDAEFDARTVSVVLARRDGKDLPKALSDKDKSTIERTIQDDILVSGKFPVVKFEGTGRSVGDAVRIEGTLTLCGKQRPLTMTARPKGDVFTLQIALNQPDYGIKPYSALMGAIKLKPRIEVVVTVPKASVAGTV